MKILLVEDSPVIQRMYGRVLEESGFTVTKADDGKQAVELAVAQIPDIIMMDVMMPNMNGIEALEVLKSNEATKAIPVVMVSANEDDIIMQKAIQLGASRYLIKGINEPAEIIDLLNTVLAESAGAPPTA
jgi:CheY-like chemotaxis protein